MRAPSHVFYVDDLMVFYNGHKNGLEELMHLFEEYGNASGQRISKEKTLVIFGKKVRQKEEILNVLEFLEGFLPFTYLGVLIFKGRLKKQHF